MEDKDRERIRIEITTNTQKILLFHFDQLLLGLDTKKEAFGSEKEKQNKIKAIKNFVGYRLKEKIIDSSSELWKLIKEIDKADLVDKETDRKFLFRLMKMNHSRLFIGSLGLKSKEAYKISNYHKQKAKEEDRKLGESVLRRFMGLFERKV